MSFAASGQQFAISAGDQHVTIVEVGGGVREYRAGDRDVLQPYPAEQMCDGAHGAPLIPWPNRLADGRYRFDRTGLTVSTTATNSGDRPCPYGCGQHPYLSPGGGLVDDCTLQLKAATRIRTDPERELPTGTESVDGTSFEFRTPRQLGDLHIDYAFTDLKRDNAGRAWVRLGRPDGHTAELWVDETFPIIELYTADTLSPDRRRRGLGTEPMSCPPNTFQTGQQVIRLKPGASITTTWGARLRDLDRSPS